MATMTYEGPKPLYGFIWMENFKTKQTQSHSPRISVTFTLATFLGLSCFSMD